MKILLIFFLISNNLFSQDLEEKLQSLDTMYIYFDEQQSFADLHLKTQANKTIKNYIYVFPDAKTLKFRANLSGDYGAETIKKKKCFLEKNKNKIITIDIIKRFGLTGIVTAVGDKKKVIYMIDKEEIRRNKIVLRRCYLLQDGNFIN